MLKIESDWYPFKKDSFFQALKISESNFSIFMELCDENSLLNLSSFNHIKVIVSDQIPLSVLQERQDKQHILTKIELQTIAISEKVSFCLRSSKAGINVNPLIIRQTLGEDPIEVDMSVRHWVLGEEYYLLVVFSNKDTDD